MAACYSQEKFNVTSDDAMALAIITLQTFAGLWINGFIVSVLCVAWVKKKIFNSNEKILLFLGCCRFGELCITWVNSFLSIIYPQCFYSHPMTQIFSSIRTFLYFSNLCVSACLCVFYCIKIANFRLTFFIYLKVKIDRMVPWLFLVSVLFALVMGILDYDITYRALVKNLNSTTPKNLWAVSIKIDDHLYAMFLIIGSTLTTALTAVIVFALLLLFSLWRHKHRMQANSARNLSVDVHIKAVKSILLFIFIYSLSFTGSILPLIHANKMENLPMLLILVFQYALPVTHSLILIFSNPKLEKIFLRTLPCVKWKFQKG